MEANARSDEDGGIGDEPNNPGKRSEVTGAAGVDDQTFEDIEAYGEERWLDELTQELKSRTYRPLPVRRVFIPKPGGKQRPLGIPAIHDRVVMMAAVLVLDPIFEVDLQPEQYAYRRGRSALDAVRHVHKLILSF